ncbi:MAG: DUF1588 domain-containing protein, partial [Limisphaerales bacterium]
SFPTTRRHFLRTGSALLTLPWLESLAPAQSAAPPRRLVSICTNFGLYGHADEAWVERVGRRFRFYNRFGLLHSKLYPEYAKNDLLKRSSVQETRAFFRRVLDENLSVHEFAAANWTFANESLAKHYGLPGIAGLALQKVSLPADSAYGRLWTQPAVLKVTANGTYTSPVKRGVWMAERLLGLPIPPPPPDIPAVEPDIRGAKTLREQLALHSSQGACAACHAKFDPYGFALESFDVTGTYRKHYRVLNPERKSGPWWNEGFLVDSSGKTPSGQTFSDIRELRKLVADQPAQLARGVTRHLVTYATGAPPTRLDQPALDAIVTAAEKQGHGLRALVHGVVQSDLFRSK